MYYRNLFRIFYKEEQKLLGRWKRINDNKILEYKIFLANSDTCYHSTFYEDKNIMKNINEKKI